MSEVIEHFTRHDVVAAPVNTIAQAAQGPPPVGAGRAAGGARLPGRLHCRLRRLLALQRTPAVVGSTPQVGEHNEEVLAGLLGYSEEEITQLRDGNVIAEFDHYDEIPG